MKTLLILAGAVVLGVGLGVGTTAARYELAGGGRLDRAASNQPTLAPQDGPQPKVEVDQEEYDFGVMERGATQRHAFKFTNAGDFPLELVKGETTCKCTISTFDNRSVAPGETVDVELEWTARTDDERFRQTATILTNDPQRPRVNLTVVGSVSRSVVVEPAEVVLTKIQTGEAATAEIKVFSFAEPTLELLKHEFLTADSADHFSLEVAPLSASELAEREAKAGLLVTVTIKPGLPIGSFRQQLDLTTSAAGGSSLIVPIQGRVVSSLSIFGPGWDATRGLLALGSIKSDEGKRVELSIFVRGDLPEKLEFKATKVTPEVFNVRFGEPQVLKAGAVMKVPLVIEIPPGTRPINRLGLELDSMGEILIESNHPQAERLRVLVHFAVEQ